jgi:hypothetical protein
MESIAQLAIEASEALKRFADAVNARAAARAQQTQPAASPPAGPPRSSGLTIPGGRAKGQSIETADAGDIQYWIDRMSRELADGSGDPKFARKNEEWIRVARAELGRRSGRAA